MLNFTTHEHFSACLNAFLRQVSIDTGMNQPKNANMLQFVIGLGAGVGPTNHQERPPLQMEFRDHHESPMKTIIHITEPGFTNAQAQRIATYLNNRHGANVAHVIDSPYLKGKYEEIEVLSGVLVEEIQTAIEYQEVFRGSLMMGTRMFNDLPIRKSTRVELAAVGARVALTPCPKAGMGQHAIEFEGISDQAQADILAAINVTYGEGSVNYA